MMTRCDLCIRKGGYMYMEDERMLWLCKPCVDAADFAAEWSKKADWDVYRGKFLNEE